jgi:hypothetical protein
MRVWFLFVVSLWAFRALASPPIPSAKELAKEAIRLQQLAEQEADPTKKQELRKSTCDAWSAAYDAGKRIEYQLALGLCKQELHDLEGAEAALRLFLMQAPQTHQDRIIAQGMLDQVVAERKAEQRKTNPPALTLNGPITTQESPKQWKRRALFATGALGGLGLVAGAVAAGVLLAQTPSIPQLDRGEAVLEKSR